jgi:hypothetical protein
LSFYGRKDNTNGLKGLVLKGRLRTAIVEQRPLWRQELKYDEREDGFWESKIQGPTSGEAIGLII